MCSQAYTQTYTTLRLAAFLRTLIKTNADKIIIKTEISQPMLHIKKMTQMYLNVNHYKVSLNHHTVTWDAPKCNQLKMYSIHTKQIHLQHMSMIQQTGHIKKERDGQNRKVVYLKV